VRGGLVGTIAAIQFSRSSRLICSSSIRPSDGHHHSYRLRRRDAAATTVADKRHLLTAAVAHSRFSPSVSLSLSHRGATPVAASCYCCCCCCCCCCTAAASGIATTTVQQKSDDCDRFSSPMLVVDCATATEVRRVRTYERSCCKRTQTDSHQSDGGGGRETSGRRQIGDREWKCLREYDSR